MRVLLKNSLLFGVFVLGGVAMADAATSACAVRVAFAAVGKEAQAGRPVQNRDTSVFILKGEPAGVQAYITNNGPSGKVEINAEAIGLRVVAGDSKLTLAKGENRTVVWTVRNAKPDSCVVGGHFIRLIVEADGERCGSLEKHFACASGQKIVLDRSRER